MVHAGTLAESDRITYHVSWPPVNCFSLRHSGLLKSSYTTQYKYTSRMEMNGQMRRKGRGRVEKIPNLLAPKSAATSSLGANPRLANCPSFKISIRILLHRFGKRFGIQNDHLRRHGFQRVSEILGNLRFEVPARKAESERSESRSRLLL